MFSYFFLVVSLISFFSGAAIFTGDPRGRADNDTYSISAPEGTRTYSPHCCDGTLPPPPTKDKDGG